MVRNEKVCHYLDIPIQHSNDTMLKRMGRRTSHDDLIRIITHLRDRIPDITLRTTLICGFPGETQEIHEELMQFINEAEILEIIDHHRIGSLETISPVYFRNQPLGCTSTIIYQMFGEKNIEIPQHIAGLLLSAILSDTLMFRSPTCTQLDILAAEALAKIAKVDIETHAKNMFKAGSDFKNKTTEEIFYSDFKIFHTDEFDFGVAQISAMSREELDKVAEKLRPFLKEVLGEKRIDMVYVMLTDILEESSRVIFEGHDAGRILADAFEREENENGILLEGIISRKKQLIPTLMNAMAEKV